MKRHLLTELISYANQGQYSQPLLLQGALGVGKTWIAKNFAKACYQNIFYIDFKTAYPSPLLNEENHLLEDFLYFIDQETGQVLNQDEGILILDHVHCYPKIIDLLKGFSKQYPHIKILLCSDQFSLFRSHPKAKAFKVFSVYPMSFLEYLLAIQEDELYDLIKSNDYEVLNAVHRELIYLLREYMYVGGMPDVVSAWIMSSDYDVVRKAQLHWVYLYMKEITSISDKMLAKYALKIWNMLLPELNKENKRFMFKNLYSQVDYRVCTKATQWLCQQGFVHKVPKTNEPTYPIKQSKNHACFKLYMQDVGLLGARMGSQSSWIEDDSNQLFELGMGSLKEQYVLLQLLSEGSLNVFYYQNRRLVNPLSYVVEVNQNAVPIQIRLSNNRHSKTLNAFCDQYQPYLAVNTSLMPYREQGVLKELPLYSISELSMD